MCKMCSVVWPGGQLIKRLYIGLLYERAAKNGK